MHNAALAACGINVGYTRLHVHADELAAAMRLLMPAGFLGVNVTLPHKTAVLPLLDSLDPHAGKLGAVNTVRVERDGTLRGFNTDGPGLVRAVAAEFGLDLRDAKVLILGAGGGAGRALATQCAIAGCARLFLVNRTHEKARDLAESLGVYTEARAVRWETAALATALREVDLIVNTTSLGLHADDPSPLPAGLLASPMRIFDTVYRRDGAPTPLVTAAREANIPAVDGLSLLLHQGELAFEHWFGQIAPLEAMRRALENA